MSSDQYQRLRKNWLVIVMLEGDPEAMEKLYALLLVRMPVKFAHWIRMRLKFL